MPPSQGGEASSILVSRSKDMTIQEAPPRLPLNDQYLGYDVPEEYRPVEKFIIEHEATGWHDLIDLFIYASNPRYCTEKNVKQTLPYLDPILKTETERREIWNLAKEQLSKLPLGHQVLVFIAANRADLA